MKGRVRPFFLNGSHPQPSANTCKMLSTRGTVNSNHSSEVEIISRAQEGLHLRKRNYKSQYKSEAI